MSPEDQQLEDHILLLRQKIKKGRKVDEEMVIRAIEYGKKAHEGHYRKSGEIYFIHPTRVAIRAADFDLGTNTVVASLLHDVLEDTLISKPELEEEFGKTVADLVDSLTKEKDNKRVTLYKIFNLGHVDARAILIKLLDRLDNLGDIEVLPRKKQRSILNETAAIYTEVAHGLGLLEIEDEMKDLVFKNLYPKSYKRVSANINQFYLDRHVAINEIVQKISRCLPKHFEFSIKPQYVRPHEFMYDRDDIDRILDWVGIEVKKTLDCYIVLGSVHTNFRSVPLEIRDYISNPKANGWKGLATRVIVEGEQVNISIVTEEFEENNRKGVMSLINEGIYQSDIYVQFLKTYLDVASDNVRIDDVFRLNKSKSIQILTPMGDHIEMRYGSTILDFAFMIHTEIGLKCAGGIIDNVRYPRNKILEDGMVVNVITSSSVKPNRKWIEYVIMPKARKEILKHTHKISG